MSDIPWQVSSLNGKTILHLEKPNKENLLIVMGDLICLLAELHIRVSGEKSESDEYIDDMEAQNGKKILN